MTHDVFLSYSRKDVHLMHRMRDSLDAAGLSAVWTDEGIEPGTPLWDQAIEEALHQARCVVVILTPNSKNAKGVRDEIHYASIHGKRVFPVLAAGDAQTSVPYTLSGTQWVDARSNYETSIRQLVSAIQLHLNRPAASVAGTSVDKRPKTRSKRPAWIATIGSVLVVAALSLAVLLWANGAFNQPSAPQPTLNENEKALTLAADTQVAVIMTAFLTETHIAGVNQTATAVAFTDTPSPTSTPSPTDSATPDLAATQLAQATLDAQATLNTPVPTATPTITATPSATITDTPTPNPVGTQTAEAVQLSIAQAGQGIGSPMVLIEGGAFAMGTTPQEILAAVNECIDVYQAVCEFTWGEDSLPLHSVTVDSFMLEVTEVTYRQYLSFLNSSGAGSHLNGCDGQLCVKTRTENANSNIVFDSVNYRVLDAIQDYPVAAVTWYGAKAYCESIGRRLPTEAEWERAARGSENFLYPWGDSFSTELAKTSRPISADPSLVGATEVGSYPPEAFGLQDMAGNVSEWTNDWYLSGYYAQEEASRPNPQGAASGTEKVVRGGSWYLTPFFARSVHRQSYDPTDGTLWIGFRCAADL